MNRSLLLIITLFICLLLIMTTGCWSRTELNELSLVYGAAIDKTDKPGKFSITAQIIKPGSITTGQKTGGGAAESPFLNLTATGWTDFDTLQNLSLKSSRRLFWAHNQIIVLGNDLAKENVAKYIDFFIRAHESRWLAWILVAKGRGSDVLDTDPGIETIPVKNISQQIIERKTTSEIPGVDLHDFTTKLMSKTTAPFAPLIEVEETGKKKSVKLVGTAVFKKGKMIGSLNMRESRGLLWVIGEINKGIIVVDTPKGNGQVSLKILRADSKVTPEIHGKNIVIHIKIQEEGDLGSQSSPEDPTKLDFFSSLETLQAEAIKNEIIAAVSKAKKYNTDIFGFGDAVYRKYPDFWKNSKEDWDELFPQIKISVEVDAKLRRTGLISKPVGPE